MLVALLSLPLLVVTSRAQEFNDKFESTERMGLDVPLTRTLKFFISDNLCSGVISSPLVRIYRFPSATDLRQHTPFEVKVWIGVKVKYDQDCQKPLAMLVTVQDQSIPEMMLDTELNKVTVLRKRNENQDCPGKAPVFVKMACPSNNRTRTLKLGSSYERPLPIATDDDLYG